MKKLSTGLKAGALILLIVAGNAARAAGGDDAKYVERIAPRYSAIAGSDDNLRSLAAGLRRGQPVTMVDARGERFSFDPPTRPMGYGSVSRALDLATRQLTAQGIANPTPRQLEASLMGGTIRTPEGPVTLQGVLQLRSDGMGWGRIAHAIGVFPSGKASATALQHAGATGMKTASAGTTTAAGTPARSPSTSSLKSHASRGSITTPLGASGTSTALARSSESRVSTSNVAGGLAHGGGVASAAGPNHGGATSGAGRGR